MSNGRLFKSWYANSPNGKGKREEETGEAADELSAKEAGPGSSKEETQD